MFRLFSKNRNNSKSISRQRKEDLIILCQRLGIKLRQFNLLDNALTHSSCIDRGSDYTETYERLEFLGDSILSVSIAFILYDSNPLLREGALSAIRSSIVDEKTLSVISMNYNLLEFVNLGKGETLSDPRARVKVSADIIESIIGVVFLEKGFKYTLAFIKTIFDKEIQNRFRTGTRDYKTQLQKWSISKFKEYPVYEIVNVTGPDHNKVFEIQVSVHREFFAKSSGKNKKEAEQKAAQLVISEISRKYPKNNI